MSKEREVETVMGLSAVERKETQRKVVVSVVVFIFNSTDL